MPNSSLPEIFNAFDVFFLPTLHEGHCNAIEEATACGDLVISSKGTSVELQINKQEGVLVNSQNIEEISNAIFELKNNKELLFFYISSLIHGSKKYSIKERSDIITGLIKVQAGS